MYVRLRGDVKRILELLKSLNLEGEVFVKVEKPEQLFEVVQKAVASGIGIEIPPMIPTQIPGSQSTSILTNPIQNPAPKPSSNSTTAPTSGNDSSQSNLGGEREPSGSEYKPSDGEILKKYKSRRRMSPDVEVEERAEKEEAEEKRPLAKKEAPAKEVAKERHEKPSEPEEREVKKAEAVQIVEDFATKVKVDDLSFHEVVKLKEEAFSRKLVE